MKFVNTNKLIDINKFTPVLWIDFSDSSTVTTSGSDITQVNDKSSSGYKYVQGTSANRPTLESAVQNGLDVARFNGTTDRLTIGSTDLFRNIGGGTIYIVRKWAASPTAARTIFQINNNASLARATTYGGVSSNKSGVGGRRLDANSFSGINSTNNVSTTDFKVATAVFDYTNSNLYFYVNKVLEGSTTSFQTDGSTSNTASNGSAIGSTGSAQFFNGDIGEILVFHAAHDDTTRAIITRYLQLKWGIT